MTTSNEQIIYNCHVHTFTIDHVPRHFVPRPFSWIMQRQYSLALFLPLLRFGSKFFNIPHWLRYARFAEVTLKMDQSQVYEELESRYPKNTRFIVLPMDLAFIRRGEPFSTIDQQHNELWQMSQKYPCLIPFFALDPRRPNVVNNLKMAIEEWGFRGIKLYPNLGYQPSDPRLIPIWEYANEKRLPIMTHCSRGGMYGYDDLRRRRVNAHNVAQYAAPKLYEPILQAYPNLKLCLAHLGGQQEWENYMNNPWYITTNSKNHRPPSWLSDILGMLKSYENLYTDISYTIFYFQDFAPALKVFLLDQKVRERILFGSDYYMSDVEQGNERMLSINLRAILGEELFWQIANVNPKRYLF